MGRLVLVLVVLLVVPVRQVSAVAALAVLLVAATCALISHRWHRRLQDRVWVHRRHRGCRVVTGICRILLLSALRVSIRWRALAGRSVALSTVLDRCLIHGRANSCMSTQIRCGALAASHRVVVVPPLFRL